jgi:PBP1b-binding outer membrane lipoprotein LpoB
MKKLLSVILLALTLSSCSKFCKEVPPTLEYVVVDPDRTPELNLQDIEWQAWNQKRLAEEASKVENKDKVFFVLTQEQLGALLDNLSSISDVFAKSIETNQYWQKSVNEYRQKKKIEAEANDKGKKK